MGVDRRCMGGSLRAQGARRPGAAVGDRAHGLVDRPRGDRLALRTAAPQRGPGSIGRMDTTRAARVRLAAAAPPAPYAAAWANDQAGTRPSNSVASASATSMPSTPADMMPPA